MKYNFSLLIIFALIANFSITKFYTTSFDTLLLSKDNYHDVDPNASFTIKTINETANTFAGFDSIKKNKDKFIEVQFSEITNKGIYHAKTFLILNKILKNKKNIKFVSGLKGKKVLENFVNSRKFDLAFRLYPTNISQVLSFAENKKYMPQKSTWFHPKPLDGLISSRIIF